ncbi:MAG: RNA polymerase sigma factor [Phycisphaerae bacterium]
MSTRFQELMLPHVDALFRVALSLTGSQTEAEDLVQETFARALAGFAGFELRRFGPRPWLLQIMYNFHYTQSRRREKAPTLLDDADFDHFADELEAGEPLSADHVDWECFDEELKGAVEELGREYRTVLLLWALEGLSYREIAEVCQCPLGTVMSRLYRARKVLTQKLRDYVRARNLKIGRAD